MTESTDISKIKIEYQEYEIEEKYVRTSNLHCSISVIYTFLKIVYLFSCFKSNMVTGKIIKFGYMQLC